MAHQDNMVLYTALYDDVDDALEDLGAIEQLHQDAIGRAGETDYLRLHVGLSSDIRPTPRKVYQVLAGALAGLKVPAAPDSVRQRRRT